MASNLFFWRDSTGNEIDVLEERGDILLPIEVKAGQTVVPDFFAALRKFSSLAGETAGRPILIYGGSEAQSRSDVEVVPWRGVGEMGEM